MFIKSVNVTIALPVFVLIIYIFACSSARIKCLCFSLETAMIQRMLPCVAALTGDAKRAVIKNSLSFRRLIFSSSFFLDFVLRIQTNKHRKTNRQKIDMINFIFIMSNSPDHLLDIDSSSTCLIEHATTAA